MTASLPVLPALGVGKLGVSSLALGWELRAVDRNLNGEMDKTTSVTTAVDLTSGKPLAVVLASGATDVITATVEEHL